MLRTISFLVAVSAVTVAHRSPAHADDSVLQACKGESKTVVTGKGKPSIGVVYPDDFPVQTTPASRNAVGARIAVKEKAKIVPAKDVFAAQKLVAEKRWSAKLTTCGLGPSLVAVLGQKHPNLETAYASVVCDPPTACELRIDIERHGRSSTERWIRYTAPLAGPKDKLATITAAAARLTAQPATDRTSAGMAVTSLPIGVVTVRSDADGALEVDRAMEASKSLAACRPSSRRADDIRGYSAEWTISALGTISGVDAKPFGGKDPSDQQVSECLRREIVKIQLACPRDGQASNVKASVCL